MKIKLRKFLPSLLLIFGAMIFSGCVSDADVASENLSKAADNFEVKRRIVFYNGITGEYMLSIEGFCSLGNFDKVGELTVTCKMEDGGYKKHFLGLSDNVTYFVEQINPKGVSKDYYRVVFKPSVIVPELDVRLPEDLPKVKVTQ